MVQWIYYAVGAYLLGAIPFGKLIAKRVARIDITKRGSGNIGATNVARVVGLRWGILTLLLDTLKGFLPVFLFALYGRQTGSSFPVGLSAVGLSALIGHQFSLFEGFRGGKGVATALGVFIGISPLACVVAVLVFVFTVYQWDYVSLGSMVAACVMPVLLALFGKPLPLVIGTVAAAALICFAHRENIRRLAQGNENKWRSRRVNPDVPEADPAHRRNKNR